MNTKLLKKPCDINEMFELLRTCLAEAESESSRGLVLTTFSALEFMVATLLWQHMKEPDEKAKDFKNDLFGGQGVVSSASAAAKVSFAVGVIDQENYLKLNALRAIRNVAAHNVAFRFEDADSKGLLNPYESSITFQPIGLNLEIIFPGGQDNAKFRIREQISKEKITFLVLIQDVGVYLLSQLSVMSSAES